MGTVSQPLSWFTPLPPARNGIADYAAMLLSEISRHTPCICYSEDPLAETPAGTEVRDPLQAFRYLTPGSRILHQIGNNGGHVFVLEALRRFGGAVSLHDLSLLYVYELATGKREALFGHMQFPDRRLGDVFARHWKDAGLKTSANYVLFDMVGEILSRSRRVIVHSDYARRKLEATHGAAAHDKIVVIPHFAKSIGYASCLAARERLALGEDEMIILTSGFATRVKRFDWLIDALDELNRNGRRFRWIHAGEERADEYDLSQAISARGLAEVATVTGYLTEDDLDAHIAAADIVVNLRFPSVGESSGTLARAFSAGRCCIVNDTAAYAELPRDAVVHVPVFGTVGALVRALDQLMADRVLRETFGRRAQFFARTTLSIEAVARRYLEAVGSVETAPSDLDAKPVRRARPKGEPIRLSVDVNGTLPALATALPPGKEEFELTLWFASAAEFASTAMSDPAMVASMLGPHVDLDSVRFIRPGIAGSSQADGRIGILVSGRAC